MTLMTKPSAPRVFIQKMISLFPGVSRREIAQVMGVNTKAIEHLLRRLIVIGVVTRLDDDLYGRPPRYYLTSDSALMPVPNVCDECRANWAGYKIHKVFGAGGAVRL